MELGPCSLQSAAPPIHPKIQAQIDDIRKRNTPVLSLEPRLQRLQEAEMRSIQMENAQKDNPDWSAALRFNMIWGAFVSIRHDSPSENTSNRRSKTRSRPQQLSSSRLPNTEQQLSISRLPDFKFQTDRRLGIRHRRIGILVCQCGIHHRPAQCKRWPFCRGQHCPLATFSCHDNERVVGVSAKREAVN